MKSEKDCDPEAPIEEEMGIPSSAATERNLEAFIGPDLPEVDDGSPPMDKSWYGYVIVVCSFIIYFIVFGTEHTFGVYQEFYTSPAAEPIMPFLKGTSSQNIAMIGTLATTFTYLLGAFSGRFADRAGYRISAVLGAFFMGAGLIAASFAKSLAALYICQGVVLGIGSSLVYLPAISCPAHWFERYRSIAIGIVVCGSGLGGLVLGPLTEHLIASVGVRWTLRIQGLLCLIGIGGSGMMLKTRVKKVHGQNKKAPMDFTICKEVPFIALTFANFLTSLGYMIPFFFLSTFAVFHHQTAATGAMLIGILNGASLVGRLSLSFITDRVGRINMLFICALVSGLSILCIWPVATTVKVITIFAVVYGFTCGGYFSVIPSVIADIYGLDRLTTVTGLLYGSIGFGYLIGSPVSAWLLDITKPDTNYIYVFIFSGTTMTLSSFAVFYLKYWRTNGRWWIHG
ncbi:major facilitator superfamily domain-containing protein [Lobosporangium transversale]|uniref:Major facilitator superfamily domain-containing protein n=1 Tax=Lobosporangium transversale TaxID=64571 RepID=A0A1Y2GQZ0_9FUNG|nr:major facilitator superfamily domain-containing protein [Lobosporangium transversale]ORZ19955.1 major facilitator superfamily domain-containing protein [Lobosporangium transversale]|eukprot:XP_021882495.1 major facilitator superfamily domain-containing protein [Lobosporangium transversale]